MNALQLTQTALAIAIVVGMVAGVTYLIYKEI